MVEDETIQETQRDGIEKEGKLETTEMMQNFVVTERVLGDRDLVREPEGKTG